MRTLAGWDPIRARQVLRWPLREALVAYVEHLRQRAREEYLVARLEYAMLAPWSKDLKPPVMPALLKD